MSESFVHISNDLVLNDLVPAHWRGRLSVNTFSIKISSCPSQKAIIWFVKSCNMTYKSHGPRIVWCFCMHMVLLHLQLIGKEQPV